jgi:hypothetical protein
LYIHGLPNERYINAERKLEWVVAE